LLPDRSKDPQDWSELVEGIDFPNKISGDLWDLLDVEDQLVLSQIITVEDILTASNTDFLAGTQLDQPGVPGVYTVWIASTVGDTTVTITQGGRTIADGAVVTLRANSEIRENEDTFYQMISPTGGRPVINVTEVTAATIRVRVKFIPAFPT